jgi:hypothetical protein
MYGAEYFSEPHKEHTGPHVFLGEPPYQNINGALSLFVKAKKAPIHRESVQSRPEFAVRKAARNA